MNPKTEGGKSPAKFKFVVQAEARTADEEITFFTEGTSEDILRRLFGVVLLTHMREEGLKEALTCLKGIFDFNLENARYQLTETVPVRTGTGTVVSVSEAPDLVISE